mgnify:FL=1|jgi:hypothetical protein
MSVQAVSREAWPSGMDNIHVDHELDAKTRINGESNP